MMHGEPPSLRHIVLSFVLPLVVSAALFVARSRTVHYLGVVVLLASLSADRINDVIR